MELEERSNIRQSWYSPGFRFPGIIMSLHVRLKERFELVDHGCGFEKEWIYEYRKIDVPIPAGIHDDIKVVDAFIKSAKLNCLLLASRASVVVKLADGVEWTDTDKVMLPE